MFSNNYFYLVVQVDTYLDHFRSTGFMLSYVKSFSLSKHFQTSKNHCVKTHLHQCISNSFDHFE